MGISLTWLRLEDFAFRRRPGITNIVNDFTEVRCKVLVSNQVHSEKEDCFEKEISQVNVAHK